MPGHGPGAFRPGKPTGTTPRRRDPRLRGLRDDADVRLGRLPAVRVLLLSLLVGDRAGDDDVVAGLPLRGRRDLVLRGQLQRVDYAQNLVEVAAGRHRIDEQQLDLLVRTNHEDVANSLVLRGRAPRGLTLDI